MAGCTDCGTELQPDDSEQGMTIRRVLWIALIANGVMFLVEGGASWFAESVSMQADAMDFFGDAFSYAVTLAVVGSALAIRARAALLKGSMMALFGIAVIGTAVFRVINGSAPEPATMGGVALLALLVNVSVAIMLFRFRGGDANLQSIWLCSRNDAIGNVAVMVAALGVFASHSQWPDLAVAGLIAAINIKAAITVIGLARAELREAASAQEPAGPIRTNQIASSDVQTAAL